jgi:hypothetical protein
VIILSGILVVLAIALLVVGIVAGADGVGGVQGLTLIYVSIAISIVSALCLAIGVFLRRKELFGAAGSAAPARTGKPAKGGKPGKAARQAKGAKEAVGQVPVEPAEETVTLPSQPLDVPEDSTVFVVRGRKRYHLENCRQLAGRDKEDLTYAEALEEGFSPCTACMPDTALAARAATSSGEPTAQQGTGDESGAAGLGKSTWTESATAGLAAAARPAGAPSRAATPSAGASSDRFGSDRSGSGGFGTSTPEWESRPSAPAPRSPLSADSAYAPPAESATGTPAWGDSASPPAVPPASWESDRELDTPSWAQSSLTERPEATRPERLPEPPAEEAGGAELGAIAPESTTKDGDDDPEPVSVTATTPAAPAAPPVTLEFTPAEPKPVQPRTADTKPTETSDDEPEVRETAATEDLVLEASLSPSGDPLGDDTPEIVAEEPTPAEEPAISLSPDIDLADDAADAVPDAEPDVDQPGSPQVRILSGTRRYHRPDCALIEDIGDEAEDLESLSRDEAKERGCTPCLVCQPDKEHTAD